MIAVELFCCAGGMAEGFRRAGIEFAFAVDRDADACASYEANLGHRPLHMDVHDLVRLLDAGWRPASAVDLVVADPPCTPWSVAGKRAGLGDERDMLRATVRVIQALRPRAYLIGNVPGLDHEPNLPALRSVLQPLARDGYCVADYASLDAADYGVPQRRRRPFWFGHRVGACISWPQPTHADPRRLGLDVGLLPWVTCRDALGSLPAAELGQPVTLRWREGSDHRPSDPDSPARTITGNSHSDGALLRHRKHPVSEPDSPARTQVFGNGGWNGASTLVWPWAIPSTTVTARETHRRGRPHRGVEQSSVGAVKLSERARAILQGFPDGWVFAGRTRRARSAQIGMAMPPPLAEAVGRAIASWFARSVRQSDARAAALGGAL